MGINAQKKGKEDVKEGPALIHSSADGHLGCFHVLAIINSAAMSIGVHVSLSDLVSSVLHIFLNILNFIQHLLTLQV